MLVLGRKEGQRITINGNIEIVVLDMQGSQIKLGINAPYEVRVLRSELLKDEMHGAQQNNHNLDTTHEEVEQ